MNAPQPPSPWVLDPGRLIFDKSMPLADALVVSHLLIEGVNFYRPPPPKGWPLTLECPACGQAITSMLGSN